jgi:hypothetical protein
VSFRFRAFDEFSQSSFFSLASTSSRRLLKPPLFFLLRGKVTGVVADVIFFSPRLRSARFSFGNFCFSEGEKLQKKTSREPHREPLKTGPSLPQQRSFERSSSSSSSSCFC